MKYTHARTIALAFVYILLHYTVAAQQTDSLTFVSTQWNTKVLKKGVVWKQASFNGLFDSRQEINVVEIDLKKQRKNIQLFALVDSLIPTSKFAQRLKAHVVMNGGFFDMKNGGAVDFIKVDGNVINKTRSSNPRANAILVFDKKELQIRPAADSAKDYLHYPNVILAGPLLRHDSKEVSLDKNAFNDHRHPRSAIALRGDKLLWIVVDGRNAMSAGMSLIELSRILAWYGAEDAMNLDGGGSSTLYIKGESTNGVVNYPSDNKKFDHEGERPVANVIYLR